MKRPYLDQTDRLLIKLGTASGAFRMLDFRAIQVGKAIGGTWLFRQINKLPKFK